jgi:hypothetical protein
VVEGFYNRSAITCKGMGWGGGVNPPVYICERRERHCFLELWPLSSTILKALKMEGGTASSEHTKTSATENSKRTS